jgi:hypothetical protein
MKKKKDKIKKVSEMDKLEEMFDRVKKIFEKEFGIQCPNFEPLCLQCEFWLYFNEWKHKVFRRFL